jgi:Uma2 family endonuclease
MQDTRRISVREARSRIHLDDWNLSEDQVPESRGHDRVSDRLTHVLIPWAERAGHDAQIGRNLAVRWDKAHPSIGVDPDVYVLIPPTPDPDETSLRLWENGHHPLLLAIEVVSPSRPDKDYQQSPEKYAVNGTQELWVFDPKLAGPRTHGGPFRIQLWRRTDDDSFDRIYAGEGPVWSPAVQGWLIAVDGGRSLAIADDEHGSSQWMTAEEAAQRREQAERAAKEDALRRQEAERAAKEDALRRQEAERAAKEDALRREEAERAAKEDALRREEAERAAKEDALRRLEALQRQLEGGPPVTVPSRRRRSRRM